MATVRKNDSITAVLDEDVGALFERLGLSKKAGTGSLKCAICETPVNVQNVSIIFADHGRPGVVCDRDTCLLAFTFDL